MQSLTLPPKCKCKVFKKEALLVLELPVRAVTKLLGG